MERGHPAGGLAVGTGTRSEEELADWAYWLYLWHLPLILVLQRWMASWPFNVHGKFALMCVVTTGVLLLLYQAFVRYTWVGAMLNGPRVRLRTAPASAA